MRTRLTAQYGIEQPVVLAGMGLIGMPPLVAAVSNAGGMGTLGGLGSPLVPPAALRRLIRATRSLTHRPFGVNFVTPLATSDHIDVCIDEQVAVVSFHQGDPPELFIARLHGAGIPAWMVVGSAAAGRAALRAGVSAVVAQGTEAGGSNRSVASSLTLIPAVVDAVAPLPVLAGGGIADGRGLAAALALGAEGVWVGTRFVASREANAHVDYKRRIIDASEADTAITTAFHGPERLRRPVRTLRNRVVREWCARDGAPPPAQTATPPERIGLTEWDGKPLPLFRYSTMVPTPETVADFEEMCLPAGESAGLVRDVRPAADIVHAMVASAERIIADRLSAAVTAGREAAAPSHLAARLG
jgi:enoyl-[acyl-carrier protein] reductase II